MRYVDDCFEPRAEDDVEHGDHDPDLIYCERCEEPLDDNDMNVSERWASGKPYYICGDCTS